MGLLIRRQLGVAPRFVIRLLTRFLHQADDKILIVESNEIGENYNAKHQHVDYFFST